jgi:hypothetical protein
MPLYILKRITCIYVGLRFHIITSVLGLDSILEGEKERGI